jgi:Regulator of ribonuclease activity B
MWGRRRKKKLSASEGDSLVIRQLAAHGANLSRPRDVQHYLYFPTEPEASNAAQILEGEGYGVEVSMGADNINWLVLASSSQVVSPDSVVQFRSRMMEVASSLGGEYDGWEAAAKP